MSESIEFTAAACQLAQEIFYARNTAYDVAESWRALASSQKDIFIRHAADIIKAHAPIRSKVVGSINPEHPWGETA